MAGGSVSDSLGNFVIEAVPEGCYRLQVHYIGSHPYEQDSVVVKGDKTTALPAIVLKRKRTRIEEVQVTAERPFIEQGLGQTTINVGEHLAGAGESAVDLMRFVPSVTTDEDNNVLLRGAPVTILVDGVETDLANILEQLPAETVDKLEIITNPSAKYSTRNGNGIINIVLKKDKIKGANGRIEAALGSPEKYVLGANYTLRMKKWTSYSNLNISHNTDEIISHTQRTSRINNDTAYLDNSGVTNRELDKLMFRQGVKFQIDKSQFIDFRAMVKADNQEFKQYNVSINRLADQSLKSHNETSANGESTRFYWELNSRYKKEFKNKSSLNVFFKYENQQNDNPTYRFIQPIGIEDGLATKNYSTQKRAFPENIYSTRLTVDYEYPLNKKLKLEAGGILIHRHSQAENRFIKTKFKYQEATDDFIEETDDSKNNTFRVKEFSPAMYAVLSTELKGIFISGGLRYEYTWMEPYSITADTGALQRYHNWLPSLQMSKKVGEKCNIGLSWSRRTKQPKYKQLNPFIVYNNLYSKSGGNPELKPQKTTNTELSVHWQLGKHGLSPSLFWKENTDMFNQYQYVVIEDEREVMFRQYMNLGNSRELGFELNLSNRLTENWDVKSNFLVMHQDIEGAVKDNVFQVEDYAYSAKITSDLVLLDDFRMQTTGGYESPLNTITGKKFEYYYLDIGLRKSVFKKKASVYIKFSDAFDTLQRKKTVNTSKNVTSFNTTKALTRRVLISFTYKFNSIKKIDKKA